MQLVFLFFSHTQFLTTRFKSSQAIADTFLKESSEISLIFLNSKKEYAMLDGIVPTDKVTSRGRVPTEADRTAAQRKKLEHIVDEVLHPKLDEKAILKALTGIKLALIQESEIHTIRNLFNAIPSFEMPEVVRSYVETFYLAVEKERDDVLSLFLSSKTTFPLSRETLISGLSKAASRLNKNNIQLLAEKLVAIPAEDFSTLENSALLDLLKTLIRHGHFFSFGREIVDKHIHALRPNLRRLADIAAESEHLAVVEYVFTKDSTFAEVRPENYLNFILNELSKPQTSTVAFLMLKFVIEQRCAHIPRAMLTQVLLALKSQGHYDHMTSVIAQHEQYIEPEVLENILVHALTIINIKLAKAAFRALSRPSAPLIKSSWSPSLQMFQEVINHNKIDLLTILLDHHQHYNFITVLNAALKHAAYVGKIESVDLILKKLIQFEELGQVEIAVHEAVKQRQLDVVIYLFNNIPGFSLDQKRKTLAHAPADFRPQVEALVQEEIAKLEGKKLLKAAVKLVKSSAKESQVIITPDNVYRLLGDTLQRLERESKAKEEVSAAVVAPEIAMLTKNLEAVDLGSAPTAAVTPAFTAHTEGARNDAQGGQDPKPLSRTSSQSKLGK